MKLYRSGSFQYILEHRVRSGFQDSTVRQYKMPKSILNNTEKKHYIKIRGLGPKINRRNLLYSFGWIISPLFDQFPCLGDFFQAKLF